MKFIIRAQIPPQKNDGMYSAPYNALDHPSDYPTFEGADKKKVVLLL
jgi:hypothetical protein